MMYVVTKDSTEIKRITEWPVMQPGSTYFDNWSDAHTFLMRRVYVEVDEAHKQLNLAKQRYSAVCKMTNFEGEE